MKKQRAGDALVKDNGKVFKTWRSKNLICFYSFSFHSQVVNYQTQGLRLLTWETNIIQQLPEKQWKGLTGTWHGNAKLFINVYYYFHNFEIQKLTLCHPKIFMIVTSKELEIVIHLRCACQKHPSTQEITKVHYRLDWLVINSEKCPK